MAHGVQFENFNCVLCSDATANTNVFQLAARSVLICVLIAFNTATTAHHTAYSTTVAITTPSTESHHPFCKRHSPSAAASLKDTIVLRELPAEKLKVRTEPGLPQHPVGVTTHRNHHTGGEPMIRVQHEHSLQFGTLSGVLLGCSGALALASTSVSGVTCHCAIVNPHPSTVVASTALV
jgi:hypothetical protein